MPQEDDIQQISMKHPELTCDVIRQIVEACHKEISKEARVELILDITKQCFLSDEADTSSFKFHLKAYKSLKPAQWIIDASVLIEIEEVFGSFDQALDWLRSPHPALGGERPGDYCTRYVNGHLQVAELLQAIKRNSQ